MLVSIIVFFLIASVVIFSIIASEAYISGTVDGDWGSRLNIPRFTLFHGIYEASFQRELNKKRKANDRLGIMVRRAKEYERKLAEKRGY